MHIRDFGTGAPIVFVHGFPFHGAMWDEQLAALPSGWRGIAPDLRGFGRNARANDVLLSMDRHADDLVGLLEGLGVERAVFCGSSMGGYILFSLWRRYSARVRGLVLCDTRAGADTEKARKGRRDLAKKVKAEGSAALTEVMLPQLLSEQSRQARPELVERVRGMIEGTPATTTAAALLGLAARENSTPVVDTIDVPTLVVVGEHDEITPPAESTRIHKHVKGSRLVIIPGAGHLANMEKPAEFNAALNEFLIGLTAEY